MPDRTATPEELLDRWLDALNAPDRATPPPAPAEIKDLATVALEYRRVLGDAPTVAAGDSATPERNGTVSRALPLASPNGRTWTVPPQPERRAGWAGGLSSWLATAMVAGLLIALVGGAFVRLNTLPGGSGDPTRAPGIAASPASSRDDTPSCGSPGYRPVVEGEANQATLAAIGETEAPLRFDGAHIHVPTSDGETVTLANTWTPLGGPMWSSETAPDASGDATIRNVETGEEWTFPDAGTSFPGVYAPPYLIVPANGAATDFRVIDTETGEETLTSELRGERFPAPVRIGQIAIDYNAPVWPRPAPTVLLFSADEAAMYPGPGFEDPDAEPGALGPNALYLPPSLDDARFVPDAVHARYFHETAYSPAANRLAFATEVVGEPAIVVIRPGTDDRLEIRHPDITADSLPLMFSEDGTMLVVSRPGALITFDLRRGPQSVPLTHTSDEPFMPIAHNAASMNVLVQYPDGRIAIVNAGTGEVTDLPTATVPVEESVVPADQSQRLSFETDVYELFDKSTTTVRYINLKAGMISPEAAVLDTNDGWTSASSQPRVEYRVRYPNATWPGGHAWLDAEATLRVVPTEPGAQAWGAPAPDDFTVGDGEAARLFTNPDGTCLVLEVATAKELGASSATRSVRIATWIMPLKPDAAWTKLDTHVTGWFPILQEDTTETLPAQDFTTPEAFAPSSQTADGYPTNLRHEPTTASTIVETLPPGTPLDYLDEDAPTNNPSEGERWMKVTTKDGVVGWIREIDLKPYP